jgi:hypothetical protein
MHHNVTIGRDTVRPLHGACSAMHTAHMQAERTGRLARQSCEPNGVANNALLSVEARIIHSSCMQATYSHQH